MLISALEEEVEAYVEQHAHERDAEGRRLVVHNGQEGASRKAATPSALRVFVATGA